jgi:dTDP-4-dehydrorhamnose 3,5-epimerase
VNVRPTELPEVLLIEPRVFRDDRGYFLETWQQPRYGAAGAAGPMLQDNVSWSRQGVVRGLHYQQPHAQGKLVQVLAGEIFDVAVDLRVGSPRFGRWVGVTLSADDHRQVYVPPGFAHGFCVVSSAALVSYKCTELYHADCDAAIAWNDPDLGIAWPSPVAPIVSAKDAAAPRLCDVPRDRLPQYDVHPACAAA